MPITIKDDDVVFIKQKREMSTVDVGNNSDISLSTKGLTEIELWSALFVIGRITALNG